MNGLPFNMDRLVVGLEISTRRLDKWEDLTFNSASNFANSERASCNSGNCNRHDTTYILTLEQMCIIP